MFLLYSENWYISKNLGWLFVMLQELAILWHTRLAAKTKKSKRGINVAAIIT